MPPHNDLNPGRPLNIAVVGTGISGMAAAWLLSKRHVVTLYEKDDRIGGHTNTVMVDTPSGPLAVDTGFIVYNERNYPNLTALFHHLGVASQPTEMSFAASLDDGRFEYSGSSLSGLLAQRRNILRPRFWRMLRDVLRFYREAPKDVASRDGGEINLRTYLNVKGYGQDFIHDHLLPMGAAIWSTPVDRMLDYPLGAFVRFCDNHGLLQVRDRPQWRTVTGGSREYVQRLTAPYANRVLLNTAVASISREEHGVSVEDRQGGLRRYDHVVLACHADQALEMLDHPDAVERRLLGAFGYARNVAILHTDAELMPQSRRAWSSWNFLSRSDDHREKVSVTYWMNRLQRLPGERQLFVTLNPTRLPRASSILRSFLYEHPIYDLDAARAQRMLWNLQGLRRTWYCGAYFGHGFHEDGLQAGLAMAEQLGGVRRPWSVDEPNGRIHAHDLASRPARQMVAA